MRPHPARESGHLLIVLMVGITVMLIMMTVAAQSWTFRIRREMEVELIWRGEQYVQGLQRFREATGGFPLGNLEVLANKSAKNQRFMRKLYANPFGEEGKWEYLYLHPGGSGFINPCANVKAASAFAAGGMLPVQGMQMIGGNPAGAPGTAPAAGLSQSRSRNPSGTLPGTKKLDPAAAVSAMDPETFKLAGVSGMNLPIVGVVNCEQAESIRAYQGQTWLSNWAFTPLAQGEFGGKSMGGGSGKHNVSSGLGMSGAQGYKPGAKNVPGRGIYFDDDNRTAPGRHRRGGNENSIGTSSEDREDQGARGSYQWRRNQGDPENPDAPPQGRKMRNPRNQKPPDPPDKHGKRGDEDPNAFDENEDPNAWDEDDEDPNTWDEDEDDEDDDDDGDGRSFSPAP